MSEEPTYLERLPAVFAKGLDRESTRIPEQWHGQWKQNDPDVTYETSAPAVDRLAGVDAPYALRFPEAPSTERLLAELVEVYAMSLIRGEPFSVIENDAIYHELKIELETRFDIVDPFWARDGIVGASNGPLMSALFELGPVYGDTPHSQVVPNHVGQHFCTELADFVKMQTTAVDGSMKPSTLQPMPVAHSGRTLATMVHNDFPLQKTLDAALVLYQLDGVFRSFEGGFVGGQLTELLRLVTAAQKIALQEAWRAKWEQTILRPEELAWLVDQNTRDIVKIIGDRVQRSQAARLVQSRHGSMLLPMAYPEGSPRHPSRPAGHSVVAGACAALLKAWFADGPFPGKDPRLGMTVHGEINKMALNTAQGRSWAGVHYRSDNLDGLDMGEHVGIRLLQGVAANDDSDLSTVTFKTMRGVDVALGPVEADAA